eukprot:m.258980 g.258980  ORF g.258980 m.258980 type:complete len:83 (-) comp17584_c0_seq56:994-1242(-)
MRTHIKTRIPMTEILSAEHPGGKGSTKSYEFVLNSAKRTYAFRCSSPELSQTWIAVLNTVAPSSSRRSSLAGSVRRKSAIHS